MNCDTAQLLTSQALDAPLAPTDAELLDGHRLTCAACRRFAADVLDLRTRLRLQPVGHVPDVSGEVRRELERRAATKPQQQRRSVVQVAAVFLAAFVAAGLVAAQLTPAPVLAEDLGRRVLVAQRHVDAMSARVTVVERGWHPEVAERTYQGRLDYDAPESMRLRLRDQTRYPPGGWQPNHTDWFVDDDAAAASGLRPCPSGLQPSCSAAGARSAAWRDRGPFDPSVPVPLDVVVPVASFAATGPLPQLGRRTIDGRDAIGVRATVAQAQPLLEGILRVGNWRQAHPSDAAEVWLDEELLVPLAVDVFAAGGAQRRQWAVANGYDDSLDEAFLEIRFADLRLNDAATPVPALMEPPVSSVTAAGGFRDEPMPPGVPQPTWLPAGMAPHRTGAQGDTVVASWSDGTAWLRIASTATWEGPELFGGLDELVTPRQLDAGIVYVGHGGRVVGLHARDRDVAVTGSLDPATLLRVAGSLGLRGEPVPRHWTQGAALTEEEARELVPDLLVVGAHEGFAPPAVRVQRGAATFSYVGPGSRAFLVVQSNGDVLSPPFAADVIGLAVRGREGRFTPSRGELEWVEGGRVITLRSDALALDELLGIAERLRPIR